MGRRTPTVCNHPGCPELTPPGETKCPAHRPAPWQGSNRRQTLPKDWAARRARVLERDAHLCTHPGCVDRATHVDHVVPHHLGGGDAESNLASLCARHHQAKTLREAAAARAVRRK